MAAFVKRALTYAAFQYPNATQGGRINIYCEGGYRLYIIFQEGSLGTNSMSGNTGVAYEKNDDYMKYIDLLRNESPVWVTFNTDAKVFVVYAAGEPVGEDEA